MNEIFLLVTILYVTKAIMKDMYRYCQHLKKQFVEQFVYSQALFTLLDGRESTAGFGEFDHGWL